MKVKPREDEPSMKEIFSWGLYTEEKVMQTKDGEIKGKVYHEFPDKNDYTKNNAGLANKIRKMQTPFISESHDNFRSPTLVSGTALCKYTEVQDEAQKTNNYLFDYFDQAEVDLEKKRKFKQM